MKQETGLIIIGFIMMGLLLFSVIFLMPEKKKIEENKTYKFYLPEYNVSCMDVEQNHFGNANFFSDCSDGNEYFNPSIWRKIK